MTQAQAPVRMASYGNLSVRRAVVTYVVINASNLLIKNWRMQKSYREYFLCMNSSRNSVQRPFNELFNGLILATQHSRKRDEKGRALCATLHFVDIGYERTARRTVGAYDAMWRLKFLRTLSDSVLSVHLVLVLKRLLQLDYTFN